MHTIFQTNYSTNENTNTHTHNHILPSDSLVDREWMVGFKELCDTSTVPTQDLIQSTRMMIHKATHIVYLYVYKVVYVHVRMHAHMHMHTHKCTHTNMYTCTGLFLKDSMWCINALLFLKVFDVVEK